MAVEELTTAQLRVLSHPTRLAFLRRLRSGGPATARVLGREFEMDSGAASYHLRRLAQGGLIVEDTELGTRRERWWRAVDEVSQFDPARHRDQAGLSRDYLRSVIVSRADEMQRIAAGVAAMPAGWLDLTLFFDHRFELTADQMSALKQDLLAVIRRHAAQPPDPGADTRQVVAHLQLYPQPDPQP